MGRREPAERPYLATQLAEATPVHDSPAEIRKAISTTNAIESAIRRLCKST